MRVVFLGTPEFAVPSLRALLDNAYDVCAVFSQPDRPAGRGQILQPTPVKVFAQNKGIPVYQPDKIRKEENRSIFEALQPDFVAVAAYGQILPGWLLQAARMAAVNIHASLLPRYRGAAPIPWAILNGDLITGVTTMQITEELDSGPILLQQEFPISLTMTTGELSANLSAIGAKLLIQTLDGLQKNSIQPVLQDENHVSWAKRITKDMAQISWQKSALEIHNHIRAMNPWPVANTYFRDKRLQVWRTLPQNTIREPQKLPGTFLGLSGKGFLVQCGASSALEILEVQLPAKNRVTGREFANGARLQTNDIIFPASNSP